MIKRIKKILTSSECPNFGNDNCRTGSCMNCKNGTIDGTESFCQDFPQELVYIY